MNNKLKRGMILILACAMLMGAAVACGNKGESKEPGDSGSITVLQPDTNTDPQSGTTVQQPDMIWDFGTKERSVQHNTIAVGGSNVFAVRNDGTVAFCKSEYSVFDTSIVASWTDVVSIDTDGNDLAALRADGTVVCTNSDLDVSEWTDIVAIEFVSQTILFGLKKDGTVVCTNPDLDVSEWTDIVAMDKNVAVKRDGTVFAANYQYGNDRMTEWTDIVAVSVTGSYHTTVGLKKDGTCVSCGFTVGNERDVDDWTDIVAISAGENHTVGLRRDGTVVACGTGSYCNVGGWTEIVAISAGDNCTAGLRRDGSVVYCGRNSSEWKEVADWKDIQIGDVLTDASPYTVPTLDRTLEPMTGRHTFFEGFGGIFGIRPDGTLFFCGDESKSILSKLDMNEWTDLIAIDYTNNLLIGVKNDGTVVSYDNAYGAKDPYHSEVSDWTDIVAVSSSSRNGVIGLKKDGTVVSTGYLGKKPDRYVGVSPDAYYWDDGELADWTDLVMVAAGANHAVGLKSDGTCVACNSNEYGQCNVSGWTDIVAICANDTSTFGIRRDGTVVVCGEFDGSKVAGWTDIVAISAFYDSLIGLRKDGTVVACGNDENPWDNRGQWDVADWTNIVAIGVCNYEYYTVGLRTDGVFMVAGYDAPFIYGDDNTQGILIP